MGINVVQTGAFTTLDGIHAERLHDVIEALISLGLATDHHGRRSSRVTDLSAHASAIRV